jgi:uncharacterized protein YdaU (DUF1376 family)
MAARPDSWMPMYWPDYWRDTGHLSGAQHGAYVNLIGRYWCSGKPLPDDDEQLWRLALCDSRKAWVGMRSTVLGFFRLECDGWRHKRIDAELTRAVEVYERRAKANRENIRKRYDKPTIRSGVVDGSNTQQQPQPQQSSEPIGSAAAAARPMTVYDVGEALLTLDGTTKPATARSLIAKLCKANGDDAVQAAIDAIRSRDPPPADMKSALIAAVANRGKSNGRQSAMAEGFDIVDRIIAERG